MREAVLHARKTYTAKVDSDAWFCEGLSLDSVDTMELNSRTTQRVQMVILFLYYRQEFRQAFTWSCALLRRLFVLGTVVVWQNYGRPIFPVPVASDKVSLSTSNSAVAKETLDTALRCVLHCDIPLSEAEPVLAAGFQKARLPDGDYAALYQDGHVNNVLQKACAVRLLTDRSGRIVRGCVCRWATLVTTCASMPLLLRLMHLLQVRVVLHGAFVCVLCAPSMSSSRIRHQARRRCLACWRAPVPHALSLPVPLETDMNFGRSYTLTTRSWIQCMEKLGGSTGTH